MKNLIIELRKLGVNFQTENYNSIAYHVVNLYGFDVIISHNLITDLCEVLCDDSRITEVLVVTYLQNWLSVLK